MVRIHQVIGRARRIKSHINLPEEFRTVQAFLYLTTFGEDQVTQDKHKEFFVRKSNLSRDKKTPITTDEKLYELSRIKDEINQQIMKSVKETSIDCSLHSESDEFPDPSRSHPSVVGVDPRSRTTTRTTRGRVRERGRATYRWRR